MCVLLGHDYESVALAYSPDGTRVASVDWYNNVLIWDTQTGQIVHRLNLPPRPGIWPTHDLAWSPDGTRIVIAGSGRDAIQIWNARSGTHERSLTVTADDDDANVESRVVSVRFSPDGRLLASVTGTARSSSGCRAHGSGTRPLMTSTMTTPICAPFRPTDAALPLATARAFQ